MLAAIRRATRRAMGPIADIEGPIADREGSIADIAAGLNTPLSRAFGRCHRELNTRVT
jgi:hypothetical protein